MSKKNTKFRTRRCFSLVDYYGIEAELSSEKEGLWLVSKTYHAIDFHGPGEDYHQIDAKGNLPLAMAIWYCADFEKRKGKIIRYGRQSWEKEISEIPDHFSIATPSAALIEKNTNNFPKKEALFEAIEEIKSFSSDVLKIEEKAQNPFRKKEIWVEATKDNDGKWQTYQKYYGGMRNNKIRVLKEISKGQSLDAAIETVMQWRIEQFKARKDIAVTQQPLLSPEHLLDMCEWVDYATAKMDLAEKKAQSIRLDKIKKRRSALHKKAADKGIFPKV